MALRIMRSAPTLNWMGGAIKLIALIKLERNQNQTQETVIVPRYRVLFMWREYINDCTHIGAKNKAIDLICKDLNIEPTEHLRQYFTAGMTVEDLTEEKHKKRVPT